MSLPDLPQSRVIAIHVHSAWGDQYHVGLIGIQIFNEVGKQIEISDPYSSGTTSDINLLLEYFNDSRTLDILVDGVYYIQSDMFKPFLKRENQQGQYRSERQKENQQLDISLFFDNQIVFRGNTLYQK